MSDETSTVPEANAAEMSNALSSAPAADEVRVLDGPARTPVPPGIDCPGCGYPLGGLPVARCPECGRVLREVEVRQSDARRVFLQLTGVRVAVTPLALVLLVLVLHRSTEWVAVCTAGILLCAIIGELHVRQVRGTERTLARRLWWVLLPYTQGAWAAAFAVHYVYFEWIDPWYFRGSWPLMSGDYEGVFYSMVVTALAAGVLGWFAWWWKWRSLCDLLGVSEEIADGRWTKRAARTVHGPPLLITGLLLLVWLLLDVINALLDWFPALYSMSGYLGGFA